MALYDIAISDKLQYQCRFLNEIRSLNRTRIDSFARITFIGNKAISGLLDRCEIGIHVIYKLIKIYLLNDIFVLYIYIWRITIELYTI